MSQFCAPRLFLSHCGLNQYTWIFYPVLDILTFLFWGEGLVFGGHTQLCTGVTPGSCTQELLLAVLGGPYGMLMLGFELGSAACKANALPAVLLLQP